MGIGGRKREKVSEGKARMSKEARGGRKQGNEE